MRDGWFPAQAPLLRTFGERVACAMRKLSSAARFPNQRRLASPARRSTFSTLMQPPLPSSETSHSAAIDWLASQEQAMVDLLRQMGRGEQRQGQQGRAQDVHGKTRGRKRATLAARRLGA